MRLLPPLLSYSHRRQSEDEARHAATRKKRRRSQRRFYSLETGGDSFLRVWAPSLPPSFCKHANFEELKSPSFLPSGSPLSLGTKFSLFYGMDAVRMPARKEEERRGGAGKRNKKFRIFSRCVKGEI